MVFSLNGDPETPLSATQRKMYDRHLDAGTTINLDPDAGRDAAVWRQFQQKAEYKMGQSGHFIASGRVGDDDIEMGISRDDLMRNDVPTELQRGLLLTRLHQELGRGRAPKISSSQFRDDWRLWQEVNRAEPEEASRHSTAGN